MKVVILCGGMGTRIRDVSDDLPKPMIPVGGKPILWHILQHYRHFGFKDFILCLGFRGDKIKDWVAWHRQNGDLSDLRDCTIRPIDTGLETMTGGRLRKVSDMLPDGEFLLTYGDGLCPVDINHMVSAHRNCVKEHKALGTVLAAHPTPRFGILGIGDSIHGAVSYACITSFEEKKESQDWISGGFFVLDKKVCKMIAKDECIFEHEVLPALAQSKQLFAYRHEGWWGCMDTHRDYLHLNELAAKGRPPWQVWE